MKLEQFNLRVCANSLHAYTVPMLKPHESSKRQIAEAFIKKNGVDAFNSTLRANLEAYFEPESVRRSYCKMWGYCTPMHRVSF